MKAAAKPSIHQNILNNLKKAKGQIHNSNSVSHCAILIILHRVQEHLCQLPQTLLLFVNNKRKFLRVLDNIILRILNVRTCGCVLACMQTCVTAFAWHY